MPRNPGDHEAKLELFRQASDLLGGREATARALRMSDRSLRYLLAGEREIHTGLLEDISKALIDHARQCQSIERQLSPAFNENLVGIAPPPFHSAHARRNREGN